MCLIAGGSPAADYLSCFAKKGNPKKATPIHRPFGVPCAARQTGRLRNSRYALRQCSPTTPGLSVLLGGGPRGFSINPIPTLALPLKGRVCPCHTHRDGELFRAPSVEFPPTSPLRRFGLASKLGAFGCALSELRGRARLVCPARASCADAQFVGQTEGTRRAAQRGAFFFGFFLLGKQKKETRRRAAPAPNQSMHAVHSDWLLKPGLSVMAKILCRRPRRDLRTASRRGGAPT